MEKFVYLPFQVLVKWIFVIVLLIYHIQRTTNISPYYLYDLINNYESFRKIKCLLEYLKSSSKYEIFFQIQCIKNSKKCWTWKMRFIHIFSIFFSFLVHLYSYVLSLFRQSDWIHIYKYLHLRLNRVVWEVLAARG